MNSVSFSQFASKFLSTGVDTDTPLFYSTHDWTVGTRQTEDDILGESDDLTPSYQHTGRRLSMNYEEEEEEEEERDANGGEGQLGGVPSRLWERTMSMAPGLRGVSRGWRAHESSVNYRVEEDMGSISGSEDGSLSPPHSPPSFLSPTSLPRLPGRPLTEPLLPRSLYVRPSERTLGAGRRSEYYRDSKWIGFYGLSVLLVGWFGMKEWWVGTEPSQWFPSIQIITTLSLLSLVAGFSALSYLFLVRNAVRNLVVGSLFGGPIGMVGCGIVAFVGSMGKDGVEGDRGWRTGVRVFSVLCLVAAVVFARVALNRRKRVARTIKVLELASTIVMSHPPLIALCLSLSLLSTILTIPFLFILASLFSHDPASSHTSSWLPSGSAHYKALATMVLFLWTLGILRGIQKVTVAEVVGHWYFDAATASTSVLSTTRAAFSRARHQLLGTIIAASFVLAIFESLAVLARRAKAALQSTSLPTCLHPLMILSPVLGAVAGVMEVYTGWILSYAGLVGEDFATSAAQTRALMSKNNGMRDNLLIKLVLFLTSFSWGILAGLIAFLMASATLKDVHFAPVVAGLCFLVPFWTVKLTSAIIGDAADACYLCVMLDEAGENTKAVQAFSEPDSDVLVP